MDGHGGRDRQEVRTRDERCGPALGATIASLNGLFTLKLGVATCNQFSRSGFGAMDVANLARAVAVELVPMPTLEELRLVKEMIRTAL